MNRDMIVFVRLKEVLAGALRRDIWLLGTSACCSEQTSGLALAKIPCAQPNNSSWLLIPWPGRGSAGEKQSQGRSENDRFPNAGREPYSPGCPG